MIATLGAVRDLAIDRIDIFPRDIPLSDPFEIALGRVDVAEIAFVSVSLRCGATGWGEIAPFTAVSGETRDGSVMAARSLGEILVGKSAGEVRAHARALQSRSPLQVAARAGLECAMVDAMARAAGVPLWALWGGAAVAGRETDMTLPMLSDSRTFALAEQWYERGFRIFKMKVGKDRAAELRRLAEIARCYADVNFVLDANQGFDVDAARAFVRDLGALKTRVLLFEQPVPADDVDGLVAVRSEGVAVAADESVRTLEEARRVVSRGAVDCINLKIMKSGLFESIDIARYATAHGVSLMVGGMMETRLAMSFSLALALGFGGVDYFDLDTPLLMEADPLDGGYAYEGARMLPWTTPGVGATPRGL